MRTYNALLRSTGAARRRAAHAARSWRDGGSRLAARLAEEGSAESGLSLIEVVISAMIVGLIVIATFSGFDDATRASANQRTHNQATLLAAQDEERLRGLELTKLTQVGHESKIVEEGGTKYTIESFAEYVTGEATEDVLTCNSSGSAEFIKSTTVVSWKEAGAGSKAKKTLEQTSEVAVPASTTLEVKVANQAKADVSGATVTVKGTSTNLSQSTLTNGCVVFGSIPDKTVEVNATKPGWVGEEGSEPTPQSITLSSTATTTGEVTLAEPGAVTAEFDSNGGATNGLTGETIYVGQSKVGSPPNFIAGTAGKAASSVTQSNLFPFVGSPYSVYAGDCEKNAPETVTSNAVKASAAQVEPGETKTVKVELPKVNLLVMSGASASSPGTVLTSTSAKLINTECAGKTAQNYTTVPDEHAVKVVAGRLEPRYAPYAKSLELCVAWGPESSKYYKVKTTIANTKKEGTTEITFYAKAGTPTAYTTAQTC